MSNCDDEGEPGRTGQTNKVGQPSTIQGEAPYKVGNKKPPKKFQFKPGESGNKAGRPKGSKSFEAKVQKELEKKVTVNKNGKSVKMSKLDVGVTRLVDRFMTGDLKSTAIIIGLGKRNEKSKSGDEAADDVATPDEATLEFIFERLKGLMKGGSGGGSAE
jgi:hypothetical protein